MPARKSLWEGHISTAATISQLLKADLFGTHAQSISYEALSAEVVRVALWALSNPLQSLPLAKTAVSTRRLLDQARTCWNPFVLASVEKNKDLLLEPDIDRELLDTLEEQGDVLSFTGGSWLPAPLRLVPLTENYCMLVGGIPTHLLPANIQRALHFHGSFRQMEGAAISTSRQDMELSVPWQFQSLDSWLGPSPATLEDLARSFEMQELQAVVYQSDSSLEAYVADTRESQYQRWHPLNSVHDGRYLLRTSTPWGMKQFSIGVIQHHRLTRQSSELRDTDVRRLCYALDQRAGQPTRASWQVSHSELLLRSELPARERKYLSSVGILQENEEGYYPRRWIIRPQFVGSVEELLANLGIQMIQK